MAARTVILQALLEFERKVEEIRERIIKKANVEIVSLAESLSGEIVSSAEAYAKKIVEEMRKAYEEEKRRLEGLKETEITVLREKLKEKVERNMERAVEEVYKELRRLLGI